jgi:DNA polymerase III epsilon subunit-like protein
MRQVFLDTETTGLSPESGDRVVEIGCVEFVNRRPTGRTFHAYLNPERPNSPGAFDVHRLSTSSSPTSRSSPTSSTTCSTSSAAPRS